MQESRLEIVSWTAAYIDQKFYMGNSDTVNRVFQLECEITKEKMRIEEEFEMKIVHNNVKIQKQQADDAPVFINSKHQRVNRHYPTHLGKQGHTLRMRESLKTDSQMSRQCYTEINQLSALKSKMEAEKQLVAIEASKYHRLTTRQKRRQLKKQGNESEGGSKSRQRDRMHQKCSAAVSKRNSYESEELKSRNSKDNNFFMLAPHERGGVSNHVPFDANHRPIEHGQRLNRKSRSPMHQPGDCIQQSQHSRNPQSLHLHRNRAEQEKSQNSNNLYIIKTKTSKSRYNNDNQKSRYINNANRRVINNDNKQYHTIDHSVDLSNNGRSRSLASRTQMSALNDKIKQLQQKLKEVEFKQGILEQQDQKRNSNNDQSHQKDSNNHQYQSEGHNQCVTKTLNAHKDHSSAINNESNLNKPLYSEKHLSMLRRFKLNLSSSIYQYNYIEDVQTQKKEFYKQNERQLMNKQIKELKEVIRGLKLERIRHEAIIGEYRSKEFPDRQGPIPNQQSSIKQHKHTQEEQSGLATAKYSNKLLGINPQDDQELVQVEPTIKQGRCQQENRRNYKCGRTKMKSPLIVKTSNLRIQVRKSLRSNIAQSSVNISHGLESQNTIQTDSRQRDYSSEHNTSANGKELFRRLRNRAHEGARKQVQEGVRQKAEEGMKYKAEETVRHQAEESQINKMQENRKSKMKSSGLSDSQSNYTREISPIRKQPGSIVKQKFHTNRMVATQEEIPLLPSLEVQDISLGEIFTVPKLPDAPTKQTSQKEVLEKVDRACQIFGITFQNEKKRAQVCMKKYRNCVIFSLPDDPRTIVWHQSGKFYIGGWELIDGESKKHGFGYEHIPNKSDYQGHFYHGKRDGQGTRIMANGDIYTGQWKNGDKHGRGVEYRQENDSYYDGEWAYGKREGHGVMKSKHEVYIGQFKKSMKSGSGVEKFANGDIYEGQYAEGEFEGPGNYFWASGATYTGSFRLGARQGYGRWRSSSEQNAAVYEGQYCNNEKSGRGTYYWENGCRYIGEFMNDLKHGSGTFIYEDGREIDGQWQQGRLTRINRSNQSLSSETEEQGISSEDIRMMQTPSKQIQRSLLMHAV